MTQKVYAVPIRVSITYVVNMPADSAEEAERAALTEDELEIIGWYDPQINMYRDGVVRLLSDEEAAEADF